MCAPELDKLIPPFPEGWSFLISPQSLGSCCGSILYYTIFPLHFSPSDFFIFSKILLKRPQEILFEVQQPPGFRERQSSSSFIFPSLPATSLWESRSNFRLHTTWFTPIRKQSLEQFCEYLSNTDFVSSQRRDPIFLGAQICISLWGRS